ncbi:TIM barrel protein [Nocardioides sp. YIM 152588]|uniref:TIM barrel protein n=1 Tax=Nocardioides sp. YIM 152588 TaxID=3158259 RepID=UPI0032E41D61
MTAPSPLHRLTLATAPDSWGVWFADDPRQVTWDVYLDEIARVGYAYTELGPPGFMPQDHAQLRDELAARDLTVCGGTVFAGLHKGAEALEQAKVEFAKEARLLAAVGAEYLVHLPEQYTDQHTGESTQGAEIDPEQWKNLVTGTDELARYLLESFGVKLVFHPHADTHVDTQPRIERFLADTDPDLVNLCLDTGHVSYCEGDNVDIVRRFPERITYVHLKSVDAEVRARVLAEGLPMSDAVQMGVMCEPWDGEPHMPTFLGALGELDRDIYTVIEQDLYPVEPDVPLPIGARTAGYYAGCGLGPVRRWRGSR